MVAGETFCFVLLLLHAKENKMKLELRLYTKTVVLLLLYNDLCILQYVIYVFFVYCLFINALRVFLNIYALL